MPNEMTLEVQVDRARLDALLAEAPATIRRAVARWLPLAGQLARREMVLDMNRKFTRPTGATAASVVVQLASDAVEIGPTTPYAPIVNEGWDPFVGVRVRQDGSITTFLNRGFPGHHFIEDTAEAVPVPARDLLAQLLTEEMNAA